MPVDLDEQAFGKVLVAKLTGKLTEEDYNRFIPDVERLIEKQGSIRMLIEMRDFHGWTAGALWQDIKFDVRHFRDIERLALVGETVRERVIAVFYKPFTTATVRYFDHTETNEAHAWVEADLPFPHESTSV